MNLIKTNIGRLRILGFFEGLSLLVLVIIGMPMKRILDDHTIVQTVGPIHGALFLLFVINALLVSVQYKWSFKTITWKVLLSTIVPFGTFYIDKKILSKL